MSLSWYIGGSGWGRGFRFHWLGTITVITSITISTIISMTIIITIMTIMTIITIITIVTIITIITIMTIMTMRTVVCIMGQAQRWLGPLLRRWFRLNDLQAKC